MQKKKKNEIQVSVIIPTYNRANLLERAIQSVLSQTHPVHEIIVVDDGSTDNTKTVVSKYAGKVQYIFQQNAGPSAARNRGIKVATGDWITFLDSDDEWFPEKIERQLSVIEKHPELKWCACNLESQNESGYQSRQIPSDISQNLAKSGYFKDYFEVASRGIAFQVVGMMVSKNTLDIMEGFDERLINGEDEDLWWRIALKYPCIGYVPISCYRTYITDNSLSRQNMQTHYMLKSIEKIMQIAIEDYPDRLQIFSRFARARVFRYLVYAIGGYQVLDQSMLLSHIKRLPPSQIQMVILRLLRILPHPVKKILSRYIADIYRRWCLVKK